MAGIKKTIFYYLIKYSYYYRLLMNLFITVRVEYVQQNRAFVYQQQFLAVRSVYVRKIKLVKINLMI